MTTSTEPAENSTGDELLRTLSALASAPRLRIIAAIMEDRTHVSQLARDLGMSRPLVHLHLNRLESAGLVQGQLELSSDGKAMKFYEVSPFALHLTPEHIASAARTLSIGLERDSALR